MNTSHRSSHTLGVAVLLLASSAFAGCGSTDHSVTQPTLSQHSVSLSWNASSTPNVQYNVYRGTQHLGPYPTKLSSAPQSGTTFTDSTVQNGTTYYYVVTAIDAQSRESIYSSEVSAAIPPSSQ
jgi:fibronectin type 3 domain-containing protein